MQQNLANRCAATWQTGGLLVAAATTLLGASQLWGATTSYHIGNSFTADSQPAAVAAMAAERGLSHTIGAHVRCGRSLPFIWDNPEDVCLTPPQAFGTYEPALTEHPWNAVTLQPYPADSSTLLDDETAALDFISLARTNVDNVDTEFYVYATWPSRSSDYQQAWTASIADVDATPTVLARDYFDHLINRVRPQTEAEVFQIPAGEALFLLDQKLQAGAVPDLTSVDDLYRDGLHLSGDLGRFVASLTTFTTVLGETPFGVERPDGYFVGDDAFSDEYYAAVWSSVWEAVATTETSGHATTSAADFSLDGVTDATDLAVRQSHLGRGLAGGDLLAWQRDFQPTPASTAAVPEPFAGTLVVISVILTGLRRGARRRSDATASIALQSQRPTN